jgi:glucose-6-phosphate 1-dehydrogenase
MATTQATAMDSAQTVSLGYASGDLADATIVIFGASGDLTARKLLPALFRLWQGGYLSKKAPIVGVARREKSDADFRHEMFDAINHDGRSGSVTAAAWEGFARQLFYRTVDLSQSGEFPGLARELSNLEKTTGGSGQRLYYMATMPELFVPVVESVAAAGMVPTPTDLKWLRMVFEKPFGHDLDSARQLSQRLGQLLAEDQIYRIDHYLGKETVQNILLFRFGNAIFEPLFDRTHVDHVQITVAEDQGMEHGRGGYYNQAGAMRDVLQNHVLQLLALIAMEPPSFFRAKEIHDEKVKVLEALAPPVRGNVSQWAIRGQYTAGKTDGKSVKGYLEEERIPPESRTETYAALDVRVDNWRWEGVPFYVRTGKRMPSRVSEIALQFKQPPLNLFKTVECEGDLCQLVEARPNTLIFRIQPSESISLRVSTKRPGMQYQIHPVKMDFTYDDAFATATLPEAYERLLLDVLRGDTTLFMRNDELDAAWRLVTPVLEAWQADASRPEPYAAGSWGPAGADELLARHGRSWRKP